MGDRDQASGGAGARRYRPDELPGLDLATPDERVVWAAVARASSTYSSSYGAGAACGSPTVYPEGGDLRGTWLADNSDTAPWLEVDLPAFDDAVALLVCETCGPGAVHEIRDLDRDVVLWQSPPQKLKPARAAQLLYVPLGDHPPPRRLRLSVAPYVFGAEYHEIDAVGLSRDSLDGLRAAPPGLHIRHERLEPSAVEHLKLREDPRVHWARTATASSEWSSSYAAKKAVGPPRVFPRGGDLENTWLGRGRGHDEWLELEFQYTGPVRGVLVFETCGAGAVYKITDEQGSLLWGARPEVVPERKARLLHIALAAAVAPKRLRLWVSAFVQDYREIDAVALLSAPFETLAEPPPPAGQPEEGWTALEGTLVGDLPFVHAVRRTQRAGRAENSSGSVRLRLSSGEEVPLETGRTAILGVPVVRARGRWADVSRELPWAAACFDDVAADPAEEIVLEGRRVLEGVTVEAIGDGVGVHARGGFRESGRALPERLIAAALAVGSREGFDRLGADAFAISARRVEVPAKLEHPLRKVVVGLTVAAVVSGLAWILSSSLAARAAIVPQLSFSALAFSGVLAVEHAARMAFLPAFLGSPNGTLNDHRVGFSQSVTSLMLNGFGLLMGALALLGGAELMDIANGAARVPFSLGAGFASVRLALWLRVAWAPLREAASLLRVPERGSGRARVSGTLVGGPYTRRERWSIGAEHLGTSTTTDAAGNTTTQEQYRTWYQRLAIGNGPTPVQLLTPDGRTARATASPRTADLGLACRPAHLADLAYFESHHEEGDPATLVGDVETVGDAIEVRATHLVLGRFEELRRRVALQVGALVFLSLFAVSAAVVAMVGF